MALYFQHYHGYNIDGAMLHRADPRDIRVNILHEPRDGYILSFNGEIIKEQLPLSEFMQRLHAGDQYTHSVGPDRLEQDIRQVLSALSTHSDSRIQDMSRWLDHRYVKLIRDKKIVLAQHNHSINLKK